jgi:hypothetical protein
MTWQDLLKRKRALEQMQNIPSMVDYAEEWNILGAQFQAMGFVYNAADCWSRFRHYRDLERGEYVRLIDGQIAELIPVPE